jgi:hypothetical protein
MGLVTSLLIGGALAGGLFAGSKLKKKKPAPTTPELGPGPEIVPPAQVQAEAEKAKVGQRKRAIGQGRSSTILTGPGGLQSNGTAVGRSRVLTGR